MDHVAGHPHRRERRAQLVGDVGDEAALQPAQLLELADLLLQVGGHLVERRGQAGQVVLAAHAEALLELTGGEPLGDPARHPDRGHDLAGDQPGQQGDEQEQRHAGDQQRTGDEGERLLLLAEGEEVVERVGVVVGRQPDLAADHDARPLGEAGDLADGPDVGVGPGGRRDLVEARLELLRDAGQVEALGELGATVGQPAALADRRGEDHREAAGRSARDDRLDQRLLLRRLVDVEAEASLPARCAPPRSRPPPPAPRRRPGARGGPPWSAGSGRRRRSPTTTADSSRVLTTTRACIERRQKAGPWRRIGRQPVEQAHLGRARGGAGLVADAAHGHDDLGVLRVVLDLGAQALDVHVDQPGVGAWR